MTEQTCRRKLIDNIKDMIRYEDNFPTLEEIYEEIIRDFNNLRNKFEFTQEELSNLASEIYDMENKQGLSGGVGVTFGQDPWVKSIKNRDTDFADAYKEYLINDNDMSINTVNTIFNETETILDYLANPNIKNTLVFKKGLVMGDVQSGKTANYLSLINKAVDAGYKLIILISGVHNILREQTQIRVNEGFIGKDQTGVHNYRENKRANSYTTVKYDFNDAAESFSDLAEHIVEPTILVIKKQKDVLKRINEWLREKDPDGAEKGTYKLSIPMLLIDDEADNASINTSEDPYKTTIINKGIRDILDMFYLKSYVGYTATPFANIFIDPDPITKDQTEDLFPDNFIYSLESSPEYIGAKKLYIPHNKEIVKKIPDILRRLKIDEKTGKERKLKKDEEYMGCLAVGLKDGDTVTSIPESLKRAIDVWLLTIGIRKLEKKSTKHNTMLVNISHITSIQKQVKKLIEEYLTNIIDSISSNSTKEIFEFNKNISDLRNVFKNELAKEDEGDGRFIEILKEITKEYKSYLIKMYLINSDNDTDDKLNYDDFKDTGVNVIAIGGYSLSRGFTLEGLTVTYLLRESKGYDTLLQMGRWFGYRNGYAHLCRVYMGAEVIKWYTHIAQASEKLRADLTVLEKNGLTPRDFCIEVLDYAGHLEITGANKRQNAIKVSKSIHFAGRLNTTSIFFNNQDALESNFANLENLVERLSEVTKYERSKEHFIWKDIDKSEIFNFLTKYKNPNDLTEYLDDYLIDKKLDKFDVVLINNQGEPNLSISSIKINTMERSADIEDKTILVNDGKGGITDLSHEKIGIDEDKLKDKLLKQAEKNKRVALEQENLTNEELKTIEENYKKDKTITRADCSIVKEKPVLFLHILQIKNKAMSENDGDTLMYPPELSKVVACSISFPGKIIFGNNKSVFVNKVIKNNTEYSNQEEE